MSLNVYIFGVSGRMGQEVKQIVDNSPDLNFVGGFSSQNPTLEPSAQPDLVIDFSLPEALPHLIAFINKNKCALVSGTTGFNDDQFQKLKDLGSSAPIFWAANMSFGVYLMCQLTEKLAQYEKFYDFQVEETHHIHKKDKPSGTALIIESAARKNTNKLPPIVSHRQGEVFGEHSFIASSENEKLEIRHEAFSRGLFAKGAVDIGRWLVRQKPGFYQMGDFFRQFES